MSKNIIEETKDVSEKKTKNLKKLKYGSMSIVVIVLVVAITVIVNVMASVMSKRKELKIDLTADKRYDLGDESIEVLKNLDKDVEIVITTPKETFTAMSSYFEGTYRQYGYNIEFPYDMIPVILEKYEMYSKQGDGEGEVSVRYVDMNKDPDVISKYNGYYNGEIGEGSIIVYADEKVRIIDNEAIINMLQADSAAATPSLVFAGESTITSEIMNVTDSHIVNVAFVKTMNGQNIYRADYEDSVNSLEKQLLAKNGYNCTDIDIATDELDTELYDMLVIPMPQYDFTKEILDKVTAFLYNNENYGKDMVYIPDLVSSNLTNIDEFLADWSIQVEDTIIGGFGTGSVDTNINLEIADSESVGFIPNKALPIVAPYSREITILSKNNENKTTEILKSSKQSIIAGTVSEDAKVDEDMKARNVVVLSKREFQSGNFTVVDSNLLVIGSSYMTGKMATIVGNELDLITQTNTFNNANVLLNIFNTMTGKEAGVVIPEKALQNAIIAPTEKQDKGIKIIVVFAIPICVAVIGLVVLLRRNRR